jgi:hypothetical protein
MAISQYASCANSDPVTVGKCLCCQAIKPVKIQAGINLLFYSKYTVTNGKNILFLIAETYDAYGYQNIAYTNA